MQNGRKERTTTFWGLKRGARGAPGFKWAASVVVRSCWLLRAPSGNITDAQGQFLSLLGACLHIARVFLGVVHAHVKAIRIVEEARKNAASCSPPTPSEVHAPSSHTSEMVSQGASHEGAFHFCGPLIPNPLGGGGVADSSVHGSRFYRCSPLWTVPIWRRLSVNFS